MTKKNVDNNKTILNNKNKKKKIKLNEISAKITPEMWP